MLMELLTDGSKDAWAEEYGLEFAIVEDPDQDVVRGFVSGSFGIPLYVVLDRHMEMVAENVGHSEAYQLADELLETDIPDHSDEWPMPGDLDLSDVVIEDDLTGDAPEATATGFDTGGSAPFGGASCSTAAAGTTGGSLLFGLLGVFGIRRRR